MTSRRWFIATSVVLVLSACGETEDPVLAAWRTRLTQEVRLEDDELQRLRADVAARVSGKRVRVRQAGGEARPLDEAQKAELLEVLTLPSGVFDEGLRREGADSFRVLNGPARSDNAEIETTQRLLIDTGTLLPRRYEFAYAFPGYGQDLTYEILVEP